jgi:hypothetical protein
MLRETCPRVSLRGVLIAWRSGLRVVAASRGAHWPLMAHVKFSLVALILGLPPTLALGQSMRCGSELSAKGASQAKVAALCGQPAQVVRPATSDGVVAGVSDVEGEIWVYNFGPNKLMQRIRFRNGVVADIGSVGYGY